MSVVHLLLKHRRGEPMLPVHRLTCTPYGILGGVPCPPLRQVLLLPETTLSRFRLRPGDLRENVVLRFDKLHELASGTILRIGAVRVRLTFHCEPCGRIAKHVRPSQILHARGYLGSILDSGEISLSDPVMVETDRMEPIPHPLPDRIRWYLDRQATASCRVTSVDLLYGVGLSASYARALPSLLRQLPPQYAGMVAFGLTRARDGGPSKTPPRPPATLSGL